VNERKKIEQRVRNKELEIQELGEKIKAARIYMGALQDVLKLLPREAEIVTLRPGSAVAKARETILRAGKPVHISAILNALGKEGTREERASLTSSLASYVRQGEIFSRSAPNTYGLIELGQSQDEFGSVEPPTDFGQLVPPSPPKNTATEEEDDEVPF